MQPLLLNIYHSYREQYRLRLIAGADGLSSSFPGFITQRILVIFLFCAVKSLSSPPV